MRWLRNIHDNHLFWIGYCRFCNKEVSRKVLQRAGHTVIECSGKNNLNVFAFSKEEFSVRKDTGKGINVDIFFSGGDSV